MSPMRQGDEPDEFLMPVPTEAAMRQMEIQSIRQLADTVKAMSTSMEACVSAVQEMRAEVKDTRETVIRMEPLAKAIETINVRINEVEREAAEAREKVIHRLDDACQNIAALQLKAERRDGQIVALATLIVPGIGALVIEVVKWITK